MEAECDLCLNPEGTEIEPGVFVCAGCGFVHVKNRRSPDKIAQAWSDVYQSGAYDPEWPGVKARLYYVAEWLNQKYGLDGKTVLDIGAGKGVFLDFARNMGAQTAGIEPDFDNSAFVGAKGHECYAGMVESVEIPAKFDIVTILWTLENCGDCLSFLKSARKFLKDDGILVVATGSRILVPYKKPYSSYFGSLSPDLHCYRWSINSLFTAISKCGMKPEWWNDYEQRDEMIVAARSGVDSPARDHPPRVVRFLREWKETFP